MMHIGRHINVVHLFEVLEFVQESKSTMFLVLELVNGGELFDLISSPNPNRIYNNKKYEGEQMMQIFFRELVSGIAYCHANGIAHRDLKPENLLVHYGDDGKCNLKIADFGLSAAFSITSKSSHADAYNEPSVEVSQGRERSQSTPSTTSGLTSLLNDLFISPEKSFSAQFSEFLTCGNASDVYDTNDVDSLATGLCTRMNPPPETEDSAFPLRRMTSVVGSPHYVAPEIISQISNRHDKDKGGEKVDSSVSSAEVGYDGTKADVWSAGIILYAMLFRSLPFGEDLLRCPRYLSFQKWYIEEQSKSRGHYEGMLGPKWFFPSRTSDASRDLIISMLNPNPMKRTQDMHRITRVLSLQLLRPSSHC